jgi:hypothetical protein
MFGLVHTFPAPSIDWARPQYPEIHMAKTLHPRKGYRPQSHGDTTVRMSQKPVPKLPHERDESPATGEKPPQAAIAQAAEDLKRGSRDTDRSPETNRLARRLASKN